MNDLRFYLFCLLIGIASGLFSQWANRTEAQLKGPVKWISLQQYQLIEQHDPTYSIKPLPSDSFWHKQTPDYQYEFNRKGATKRCIQIDIPTNDVYETRFVYNRANQLSKKIFFADQKEQGSIGYTYDKQGALTCETLVTQDKTEATRHLRAPHPQYPNQSNKTIIWVYHYDSDYTCKEQFCLLPNKQDNYRNLLFYNESGHIQQIATFDANNCLIYTKGIKYNTNGDIKKISMIHKNYFRIEQYRYDRHHNIVQTLSEEITFEADLLGTMYPIYNLQKELLASLKKQRAQKRIRTNYIYLFDKHKNWIERRVYLNNRPYFMQKRQISYWR